VRIFYDLRGPNEEDVGMSAPELWDLEERSGVFQNLSAVAPSNSAVGGGERTVRAESLITGADYFDLLGVKPQLGRVFDEGALRVCFTHFAARDSIAGTGADARPYEHLGCSRCPSRIPNSSSGSSTGIPLSCVSFIK
jgi:hypothetical protein